MVFIILLSLIPLLFHETSQLMRAIDLFTVSIFIIDYIIRWMTSGKALDILKYPITPMAVIDLLTILPSLTFIPQVFKAFRLLRLFRAIRVFRLFRYSRSVKILSAVFRKQRQPLMAVGMLAVGYILICAVIMFQVEPETFARFYDAIYWAVVSLTTVGYGDIYASTDIGRFMTMLSSFMGIAIVSLPAGIITAGYMDEVQKK